MKFYFKKILFVLLFAALYSCNPEALPEMNQTDHQEDLIPMASGEDEYKEIDDKKD